MKTKTALFSTKMEGKICNYRMARHHHKGNQMVVEIESVDSVEKANELVGKSVVWKSPAGKEIKGTVQAAHGNKGRVRVLFETGMPGQALANTVQIQ
jgi:large subunit ribosomal protein L35Ae